MTAEHRASLGGEKRHGGLCAALGAGGAGLRPDAGRPGGALRLTGLTPFGFVAKLLLVEEQLLSGGKHELAAAIDTLQDLVGKLHSHVPPRAGFGRRKEIQSEAIRSDTNHIGYIDPKSEGSPGSNFYFECIYRGPAARGAATASGWKGKPQGVYEMPTAIQGKSSVGVCTAQAAFLVSRRAFFEAIPLPCGLFCDSVYAPALPSRDASRRA